MTNNFLPKHLITSLLLLFFCLTQAHITVAQICPSTDPDLSIGCGSSTTLTGTTTFVRYTQTTTNCPAAATTGTTAFPTNCDDCVTGQIAIGFPFNFFGNIYTTAVIQSNGILGFGAGFNFTGYSSFAIPAAGTPNNYIAGMFADIDIRFGGTITYATLGTAPNRRFVVSYNNVVPYNMGSGAGTGTASFQIILNETPNTFQIIIRQLSANWNASTSGALATSGAENIDGTFAQAVPGRNSTDWTTTGIGPNATDCTIYTPSPCTFTNWRTGGASGPIVSVPANNNVLTVSPTTTTTYTATWQCGPSVCTENITVTVVPPTLTMGTVTNNSSCITPNGSIAFTTNFGNGTYTLSYTKNGTATTSSVTIAGGTFTLVGLDAGAYTNFSIPALAGCAAVLVTTTANITNPASVVGTGVNICRNGSGSLTSSSPTGTSIAQGAVFNSGALTNTDPTWLRNSGGTTCNGSAGAGEYYDVFAFTVTTAGSYTFNGCFPTIDAHASLYQNAFNGADPCGTPGNFIIANDDSYGACGGNDPQLIATLATGITYYIISTPFFAGDTDTYSWTYTGPVGGTIISGSQVLQWYTAATGGAPIGTGTPFNPVGVAGSGLANTSTVGTTTFYLASSGSPTCRVPVTYAITNTATAPISISNSTGGAVCNGGSSLLTAVGGASGGGSVLTWYSGSCGGTLLGTGASISVSPTATTTYYVRYQGGCGNTTCATTTININVASTALTTIGVPVLSCPNTIITLTASGGTAGAGSTINWYTGANGTGTLLGTGASINITSPNATATYYVRRDGGTCAVSADAPVVINVRAYIYAIGASSSSTTFCTDKDGWQHFFNASNEIIFSVLGTIGAGSTAAINIKPSGTYYQSPNTAKTFGNCFASNESFEMIRSWNFTLSGAASGTYLVRFYHPPAERTDVENRANAWRAATASVAPTNLTCTYTNKYIGAIAPNYANNGFYWFKNTGSAYTTAAYDGLHLANVNGVVAGINYVELSGITSFSGGSGAVVLVPLVPLPVTLVAFSGKRTTPNQVKLSWETVAEIDNTGFEVEMSNDARNFENIGFMKGQGNNKTVASYEMMHTNSVGGYFRLKQIDNNGQFVYSKIIYINGTAEGAIRIYPNPSTDNVTIDLGELKTNESATVIFRSMLSVVVGERNLSQVQTEIALGYLAKGIYIVEINKNGKKTIEKVVLQ